MSSVITSESASEVEKLSLAESRELAQVVTPTQPCRNFQKGHCAYGANCKFLHPSSGGEPRSLGAERPVCRYYVHGWCRYGGRCSYAHSRPRKPHSSDLAGSGASDRPPSSPLTGSDASVNRTRELEISQFKKRFPKYTEDAEWLAFAFSPSDPDWPYDVRQLNLVVSFPEQYPAEPFSLKLGQNERIPDTVCKQLERKMAELVSAEHAHFKATGSGGDSLLFRTFLKKLDKQLEDIFTGSLKVYQKEMLAKAAGLVFVPYFELPGANANNAGSPVRAAAAAGGEKIEPAAVAAPVDGAHLPWKQSSQSETVGGAAVCCENHGVPPSPAAASAATGGSPDSALPPPHADRDMPLHEATPPGSGSGLAGASVPHGTEVRLRGLQLLGAAATLQCSRLALVVSCGRCRHRESLAVTAGAASAAECSRCHEQQTVAYAPSLVHAFSSALGYLRLAGCTPFDVALMDCALVAGCLNCSKESKLQGLQPGQINRQWCLHCHHKMEIAAEKCAFVVHQPADPRIDKENIEVVRRVVRRKVRDPAIREGEPLPDEGTCSHFKKSYRWFRFPCCGKLYPCDKCHNLQETDHEMQLANRMVCGFCSKEQAFSADSPCVACSSSLTRPKTAHWEGGKGCREKMHMDRHEAKKYASTNKTVSRKAADSVLAKKPATKNSVPRHAT